MNRFRETTDALTHQLTGFASLGDAIQAGRIKIVHDTLRCLTAVALVPTRGPARIALVGAPASRAMPNQPRHLFVRIGLGRLACRRPQRYVLRLSLRGVRLVDLTPQLRDDFDGLRRGETKPLFGASEFDLAQTKQRVAPKKRKTATAKRRAA